MILSILPSFQELRGAVVFVLVAFYVVPHWVQDGCLTNGDDLLGPRTADIAKYVIGSRYIWRVCVFLFSLLRHISR